MVVALIFEFGIRAGFWCLNKTFNGLYYLYYGTPESQNALILKELKAIKQDNQQLRETIETLTAGRIVTNEKENAQNP